MKIGFFNYYREYNNNRMFQDPSATIGDDLVYPTVYLAQYAEQKDIEVATIDCGKLESFDSIVFVEFPGFKNNYFRQLVSNKFENLYLLICECEVVNSDNWSIKNHKYFKKIFTWHDNFIDNKRYFKLNFSCKIPARLDFDLSKKNKFCTMIAGHKFKSHPLELYTERLKAIRWFEQNHPEDFDLYGKDWDKYYFSDSLSRLNRLGFLRRLLAPKYPSYKGPIKSKREILQKYKFAICYENARDIPGYITEKIFDCFFAGCVPVYWGAPNITDHIPANTFIDQRNFKTYDELYKYLKDMSEKEYSGYLDAIREFVSSDKIYPFSAEYFAKTIVSEVVGTN